MARSSLLRLSLFLLPLVAVFFTTSATDYCDKSLCGLHTHVACHNNGKFLASCPKNAKLVEMTATFRRLLIEAHNTYRNQVAGGRTKLKKACRMATMYWNTELSKIAEFNVKQCAMKHDACRNTVNFKYSGQNLAIMSTTGTFHHATALQSAVDMWYKEINSTSMANIKKLQSEIIGSIGHFTVMVSERNTHLGCAAATWLNSGWQNFLVACNYATTNMINFPVYKSCSAAGSKCTRGVNPAYTNLCSPDEVYFVNDW